MRDSTKIEQVKFVDNDGNKMVPIQTYMTPLGEIYIAFKTKNGTHLNISTKHIKNYVIGNYSPNYPL